MNITKRNGQEVVYDNAKVIRVISRAMAETNEGVRESMLELLSLEVLQIAIEKESVLGAIHVEDIQDAIEKVLADHNEYAVYKKFIIGRLEKSRRRNLARPHVGLLSDEFISKYKHEKSAMTQLGESVYYRTYSRWLPEESRREHWWETVRRAVESNCSIVTTSVSEAEHLYHNIFNLKQFLSGRTFWVGGTDVSKHYPMANYNCFRKDQQFLTDEGIFRFSDFNDGDKVKVLNKDGAWSEATVNMFGKDEIVELHLRKSNSKYTEIVHTTSDHLWFKRINDEKRYCEIKTIDLKQGDILRTKRRYEHQTVGMCSVGVQHGLVYGDGTFDKKKNHCKISLIGRKQDYLKYFSTGTKCSEGNRDSTLVYGLPNDWKTLPTSKNVEYINGFLYGLCLADASKSGNISLNQSDYESLNKLRGMFGRIGVLTSNIKEVNRNNNFGDYENGHSINIYRDTLPSNWTEFLDVTPTETKWRVEKVVKTGVIEDVYCVTEPKTNTFTLANGILTHNCSFEILDNVRAFKDLFYLLMIGSGVGVRVLKDDVAKLPKFRQLVTVSHEMYNGKDADNRVDHTQLIYKNNNTLHLIIGDSKEGWAQAIYYYLDVLTSKEYRKVDTILINYDNIRPKGEKLKTFGGTASGHTSLKNMFEKINGVISSSTGDKTHDRVSLKPIDCLDIANIIGENVVVGGR